MLLLTLLPLHHRIRVGIVKKSNPTLGLRVWLLDTFGGRHCSFGRTFLCFKRHELFTPILKCPWEMAHKLLSLCWDYYI